MAHRGLAKVEAVNISRGEAPTPGIKRMADAPLMPKGVPFANSAVSQHDELGGHALEATRN